jgi:glycosyltransferase involved in cell wall biosynthesis
MEMSIGSDINRIGDPISARYTRIVLEEADCLVTVSDDLRRKAVAMGAPAEKAHAVLNGCDLSVFKAGNRIEAREKLAREKLKIGPDYEAVVFVGSIMMTKGVRELVEAAVALRPSRPRLHVYLVGNGSDMSMIEAAIEKDHAEGYIHLVPECGFREVAEWMTAADVVTLPSYMEGCPNVVIEALGCGRPVVATNVGGIPELVNEECGLLVPPRDAGALALALDSALDRTWDAEAISARWGRDWSAPAAELLALFEGIVRNRKVAARE